MSDVVLYAERNITIQGVRQEDCGGGLIKDDCVGNIQLLVELWLAFKRSDEGFRACYIGG